MLLYNYTCDHYFLGGFGQEFFFRLGLSMRFSELEFSVK